MFTRHRRGYDNAAGEVLSLERIGGGRFYLLYRLVNGDLAVKSLLDDAVGAQFDVRPGADLWGGPQIRLGVQEDLNPAAAARLQIDALIKAGKLTDSVNGGFEKAYRAELKDRPGIVQVGFLLGRPRGPAARRIPSSSRP